LLRKSAKTIKMMLFLDAQKSILISFFIISFFFPSSNEIS